MEEPKPKRFSEYGIKIENTRMVGQRQDLRFVLEQDITIHKFVIGPSKFPGKSEKCLWVQYSLGPYKEGDKMYVAFSIAQHLMKTFEKAKAENVPLPYFGFLTNKNNFYEFL